MKRLSISAIFLMAGLIVVMATPAPACGLLETCKAPLRRHARVVKPVRAARIAHRTPSHPAHLVELAALKQRLQKLETDLRLLDIRLRAYAMSASVAHSRIDALGDKK